MIKIISRQGEKNMTKIIDHAEFMRKYKVSYNTTWLWRRDKGLPFSRDLRTGDLRFDVKEVEAWLKLHYSPAEIKQRFSDK